MDEMVDSRLEKNVETGTLCAFYGGLLTARQLEALRLYYDENLSLGEIAEQLGVSRQNIHELIARSVQKLERYERTLGGVRRARSLMEGLTQVKEHISQARQSELPPEAAQALQDAASQLDWLLRQQEGEDNGV